MKDLWKDSRGNIIGGLVVAAVLSLLSWLGVLYQSVGGGRFWLLVVGILSLVYIIWAIQWLYQDTKRRQREPRNPEGVGSVLNPDEPARYHSCFISYASKDEAFANQLHADLQREGVRCWFAPEDMKIGDKIRPTFDQSVWEHHKLLLILSTYSLASDWIEQEVETALEKEREQGTLVLFPIRLDDMIMDEKIGWAAHIKRTRHIGDFTCWKNHAAYQKAFQRLLRDLQVEQAET